VLEPYRYRIRLISEVLVLQVPVPTSNSTLQKE
jgi:hypothetical protein